MNIEMRDRLSYGAEARLDALLREWSSRVRLLPAEAAAIKAEVKSRALRDEVELSPSWWKECLRSGLDELRVHRRSVGALGRGNPNPRSLSLLHEP